MIRDRKANLQLIMLYNCQNIHKKFASTKILKSAEPFIGGDAFKQTWNISGTVLDVLDIWTLRRRCYNCLDHMPATLNWPRFKLQWYLGTIFSCF